MRKEYRSPKVRIFGAVSQITLGPGGPLPDVSLSTFSQTVGCPTGIDGIGTGTFERVRCFVS